MKKLSIVMACMLFLLSNVLLAQNKYVGAAKCKMCHMAKGKQYPQWSASKHAKAFEALKGEAALKIGKEKGIASPSTDAKCLKCHSTAAAAGALVDGITKEEGVSCETCHGAGSAYKAPAVMRNKADAMKNGLILPNEKLCVKCHNSESPTFKGFDYAASLAKIIHKNP
ncbi:MAG: cytochrome c family protein [Bacteroidetes bacterium]|nr:cytochrome c family protein [Bacteroidota bacterium]